MIMAVFVVVRLLCWVHSGEGPGSYPAQWAQHGGCVSKASQKVVLEPLETKRVRLLAIPRRQGLFRIRGISWKLFDQIHCHRPLIVKGRRLRSTLSQRASQEGQYSVDHRLQVRVRETLPQVTVQLEGWPPPSEPGPPALCRRSGLRQLPGVACPP